MGQIVPERKRAQSALSDPIPMYVRSPQGSVLSPFLFLMYMIDLPLWIPQDLRDGYPGFADDTVVVGHGVDIEDLQKKSTGNYK